MIKYKFENDFRDAFERNLNEGEVTVNLAPAYTEQWSKFWNPRSKRWVTYFAGLNWFVAGLTNINLRIFAWRTERHKTGFMKSEVVTLPEIVNMKAIPIRSISSFGKRQFEPIYQVRRVHKKAFGTDAGDVCAINVNNSSEVWDFASPYDELAALAKNLEAALSGASLASQAASRLEARSLTRQLAS